MRSFRPGRSRGGEALVGFGCPCSKKGHLPDGSALSWLPLSGRRDLNPGPQHPDCCALAWLRYAPHATYYTRFGPLDKLHVNNVRDCADADAGAAPTGDVAGCSGARALGRERH